MTSLPSPLKLLIVDDYAPMRRLLRSMLSVVEGHICECADGAAAVEICRELQPAWVTMDLQMPAMDGLATTKKVLGVSPATRVIIVTDFDRPTLRSAAQNAGAIAYVLKENLLALADILRTGQIPTEARLPKPSLDRLGNIVAGALGLFSKDGMLGLSEFFSRLVPPVKPA